MAGFAEVLQPSLLLVSAYVLDYVPFGKPKVIRHRIRYGLNFEVLVVAFHCSVRCSWRNLCQELKSSLSTSVELWTHTYLVPSVLSGVPDFRVYPRSQLNSLVIICGEEYHLRAFLNLALTFLAKSEVTPAFSASSKASRVMSSASSSRMMSAPLLPSLFGL